ncbi:tail fiber domain-containing protein [Blautia obeum]|jgi:hypothetical protein|uniref:tail fiber domain-containing protein n=1 Tax=Blautia obeum TaxID=40520 RepID=UPI000E446134|nr:tail fiber domain-containing protein [Blautia obeum]RGK95227.1 tail fiber domain-containing protein [Blautia obeum]
MIKTTAAYKEALKEKGIFHHKVIINFPDGSNDTVEDLDIYTLQISEGTSNTSSFDLGAAIAQQLTLKLNNIDGRFDEHDFNGAVIIVQVGLELLNGAVEWLDKGKFTAEPGEESGNSISVKAFDDMTKFDQPYSLSKLVYPATLGTIVRDACSCCGVTLASDTATFDNDNFIVQNRPDDSALTFRQVLQWVGQIACKFFRIDRFGKLSARWYNTDLLEATWVRKEDTIWTDIAGNAILDSKGQEISTVIEIPLKNGNLNIIDANDTDEILKISDLLTGSTIQTDDVVITGIRVGEEDGDSAEETTHQYGSDGYVLEISGNKLIQDGSGATVAAYLGERLNGIQFRPMSISTPADPAREAGDLGLVIDAKKRYHKTIFTNVEYTAHTSQNLISGAEAPTRLSSTRYSQATQVYKELRANLKKQKTEWDTAFDNLQEAMKTKNGLFPIHETMGDGSTILYFCDKPALADSAVVVKFSAAGWAMSTDGGNTWNSGWLVDGTMIAKILNVIGINAKWINTGAITVRDESGNIIFQVDMDTKKVIISGDSIVIGDASLGNRLKQMDNEIAQSKNMSMQLSNEMQTISADSEGNIPVFPTVATTAKVMYGSSDITNDCSYTITKSDSVTGSWDVDTHTYTVTGLSADNGWLDIKATYLINLSITKRFTISKQKSGKNGKQLYTWRKYASMPDGSDMSDSPDYVKLLDSAESPILDSTGDEIYTVTEAIYVGIADNKTTETPSDNPKDYIWSRFHGKDGADGIGIPGENGETSYIHTAYANSIDGTVDFSTTDTDRIYIGHYSDFEKTDSADPAKYTWARMRGEDGPPGRTYYLRANGGVLMMGQDKKITPNPFNVHAYYRDGQGDEATFKTWWVVEYSKDAGKTWTKMAFNSQTSGITINPDSYSLGADGMIRATIYTDSGRTKIADQQTWQVAVDVGMLTQEQIVEILSNDGEFKGLYYLNGHLYISLDALMGNAAILGGTKNGNGYLKIKDKKGTVKGLIDYSGYTAFTSYEENSTRMKYTGICFSDTGINPVSAEKYFSSTADIEYVETAWGIDWTAEELNISATEVSADTGTFGDLTVTNSASFTKSPKIEDMEYTTSSNTICWDGRTGYKQLMLKSSSSKRYKDIGNDISEQEIENWYNIEPLWAKYKEGYLVKGDENEGRYIPMFIAENVEAFFPEATRHQNGLVEDWNERIMIPAMFAMIKSQKEQLDRQEKLINQLYKKLNIEKEN